MNKIVSANRKSTIKILAIETSSNACSTAVLVNQADKIEVFEVFEDAPRQHNALLLPMLEEVLQQAACQLADIDTLAFGRGPGAFTGVRIATSAIQAIAFGSDIPVASISSLAALAQGIYRITGETELLVANDARMNEVYAAAYQLQDGFMSLQGQEKVIAPQLLKAEFDSFQKSHKNGFAAGTGWLAYEDSLLPYLKENSMQQLLPEMLPHAQDIAYLAMQSVQQKQLLPAEQVVPVYLRDNVAKKSTKIAK